MRRNGADRLPGLASHPLADDQVPLRQQGHRTKTYVAPVRQRRLALAPLVSEVCAGQGESSRSISRRGPEAILRAESLRDRPPILQPVHGPASAAQRAPADPDNRAPAIPVGVALG